MEQALGILFAVVVLGGIAVVVYRKWWKKPAISAPDRGVGKLPEKPL